MGTRSIRFCLPFQRGIEEDFVKNEESQYISLDITQKN